MLTANQQEKSVSVRHAFRCGGAGGSSTYHTCGEICDSALAVPFEFCGGGDGLCGGGGTNPRNVGGETLQSRHSPVCRKLYGYDGTGCGVGIKRNEFIEKGEL